MRCLACFTAVSILLLAGCSSEKPAAPKKTAEPQPPRISHFYGSPGAVYRGDPVTICYGVENTTGVRIHPPVEQLSPVANHCFQATPRASTTYTLTAESSGSTATASFAVKVEARPAKTAAPAAPVGPQLIQFFAASSKTVARGQPVTVCYGVRGAVSVRLDPGGMALPAAERHCVLVKPAETTTYKLTASGVKGGVDSEELRIVVQ